MLDLTRVAAGPFATMVLSDLGAEVVKVEQPRGGDDARRMGKIVDGFSGLFVGMNRGKRSIAVDLRAPESRHFVEDLVGWADVLVENFRFGVTDRLGVDYDSVRKINGRLIYVSISGFGTHVDRPDRPAYDIIGQAMSGIMHITGESDRGPSKCGAPIGDLTAGLWAVIGTLAALHDREQTGEGQKVDTSLIGASLSFLTGYVPDRAVGGEYARVGGRHHHLAPYQAFAGSDGRYFIVAAATDSFWRAMLGAAGRADLLDDPRFAEIQTRIDHRDELADLLQAEVFSTRPAVAWVAELDAAGVPTSMVNDLDEVAHGPVFRDGGFVEDLDQPGIGKLPMIRTPLEFSRTPARIAGPAPALGSDTDKIRELLRRPVSRA